MGSTWWYRAVGTVGIAGGFLLLGGGAAHATEAPQPAGGILGDLLSPVGGLGLGPAADAPRSLPTDDLLSGATGDRGAAGGPAVRTDRLPAAAGTAQDAVGPAAAVVSPLAPATPNLPLGALPLGNLPVGGLPVGGLPVGGLLPDGQVPALIGDALAAEHPELFGGLPLVGGGLPVAGGLPLGGLPVGGTAVPGTDLPSTDVPGGASGTAPGARTVPAPGARTLPAPADARPQAPAARPDTPAGPGRDRDFSDGRPVAGEDADFR